MLFIRSDKSDKLKLNLRLEVLVDPSDLEDQEYQAIQCLLWILGDREVRLDRQNLDRLSVQSVREDQEIRLYPEKKKIRSK